jgi:exodeoxyribonuclease VII large subunit
MSSPLTLYELNQLVRCVLDQHFNHTYWITAEVSDLRQGGRHCYFEFVEKDEAGTEPVARARAQIWANRWSQLKPKFEAATGQPLSNGMQVLAEVEVTFHEKFGYSLNVVNLNPTYTLGDIARRRKEIIAKLKEEGVFDLNKSLQLPALLNRVAVISASGAAGYQDFCNQLTNNQYGLAFKVELFEAVMQGTNVESSVIRALDNVHAAISQWDVVVIIRGGGSTSDLRGFDSLLLAENVAQFPIPVITGIGHERDNTVIDEVSHTRVKTPTAAAEFLIAHQYQQLTQLNGYEDIVVLTCQQLLSESKRRLDSIADKIPTLFTLRKEREIHLVARLQTLLETSIRSHSIEQRATLQLIGESLRHVLTNWFNDQKNRHTLIQAHINSSSPERLLKLGYSISRINGKAVTDVTRIKAGDQVMTTVANGTFVSTVNPAPPPSYDEELKKSPFNPDSNTWMA